MNLADKINRFNRSLRYTGDLPDSIEIMNPFEQNPAALEASSAFYQKYYDDQQPRYLVLGINPGRLGAGVTGIPFTDTKRLGVICDKEIPGVETHEPSSVFIYEMIDAYGGVGKFYSRFLFHSVCPLGFVKNKDNGKQVNYNYYDSASLIRYTRPFIIESLKKILSFGVRANICYCLGTGKNYHYLMNLNKEYGFFDQIIPLEHPRYIMQYKSKNKTSYIQKFIRSFSEQE
jgi:hypothetical protein